MTESPALRLLLSEYFTAQRAGKPTKTASAIARAALQLQSMEEVTEFMTQIRQHAGIQDLSMLPDVPYNVDAAPYANDGKHLYDLPLKGLRDQLSKASPDSVRISWASLYSHWGVAVFYTIEGQDYRASTPDFGPTETALSS